MRDAVLAVVLACRLILRSDLNQKAVCAQFSG